MWLAPWAGKMNRIVRCDWLPERARLSYLTLQELPAVSRKKNFLESHVINTLLTKLVRLRWLNIGLVLFCEFMDLDSVSVHKHAKYNLANIQPSWPHTWSITHTCRAHYISIHVLSFNLEWGAKYAMILITFSFLRRTLTQYRHAEHEAIFSNRYDFWNFQKREKFSNSIPVHNKTETAESRHTYIISFDSWWCPIFRQVLSN